MHVHVEVSRYIDLKDIKSTQKRVLLALKSCRSNACLFATPHNDLHVALGIKSYAQLKSILNDLKKKRLVGNSIDDNHKWHLTEDGHNKIESYINSLDEHTAKCKVLSQTEFLI